MTTTKHLSANATSAIRRLVGDLAAGNYKAISDDGRIGRLTEDDLRRVVAEYGRTLLPLPDAAAIAQLDVFAVDGKEARYLVDVPLWTAEEGPSDLMLFVSVDDVPPGVRIRIDDIRVP